MRLPQLITIIWILYATVLIALAIGMSSVRLGNKHAKRIRTWLLNRRVEQFQHPPFRNLLKLWMAKKFLLTSVFFLLFIIMPAALFFFLLGMILITPILTIHQGLTVGLFVAHYDRRHLVWALLVAPFEFGYWVLSGALGMSITIGVLFNDLSWTQSFLTAVDLLISGYWIPVVVSMLINAFGETAGPIYWNMTGPVSLEALWKGEPVDENA